MSGGIGPGLAPLPQAVAAAAAASAPRQRARNDDGFEVRVFVTTGEHGVEHGLDELYARLPLVDGYAETRVTRARLHVGDMLLCVRRRRDGGATDDDPSAAAAAAAAAEAEAEAEKRVREAFVNPDAALGTEQGWRAALVAERKTLADMVASARERDRSGVARVERASDQSTRCGVYCARTGCRPVLLLEGYAQHAASGTGARSMGFAELSDRVLNAALRHGWCVLHTVNSYDSAHTLCALARFLQKHRVEPERWRRLDALSADAVHLSVVKAANATPAAWLRNSLAAVPGMAADKAEAVCAAHPSLRALTRAVSRDPGAARRALAAVQLPRRALTKTGKARRLGPVLAARLVNFVTGVAAPTANDDNGSDG